MPRVVEVSDVNTVTEFLADQPSQPLLHDSSDCIVICVSAILYQAEWLFSRLRQTPHLTKTLVLCGGKGHSTQLLYDAIAESPQYAEIRKEIEGLAESRVLEKLAHRYYGLAAIKAAGCQVLVEDKSTNCGANAIETREVLRQAGCLNVRQCVIIQDPTMSLRTKASFIKVFDDLPAPPSFISCPIFVPHMEVSGDGLKYAIPGVGRSQLWAQSRFFELLMGEIPRLRDDDTGYGPKGKGYIPHVDVPIAVEEAWTRLSVVLNMSR